MSAVKIEYARGSFTSCQCMRSWWAVFEAVLVLKKIPVPWVAKGSYVPFDSKSGATHMGGGVADLSGLTKAQFEALDDVIEWLGGAGYLRLPIDGFVMHEHFILIGCEHASDSAKRQVTSWKERRNALRSNLPDRDTTRPTPSRDWEEGVLLGRAWIQRQKEDEMLKDQNILDPYDHEGTKPADRVLSDAARYAFSGFGAAKQGRENSAQAVAEVKALRSEVAALTGMVTKLLARSAL